MTFACEGSNHRAGEQGHDETASAAWLVEMACSQCEWSDSVRLCASRVRAIRASVCTMSCPQCAAVMSWRSMWRALLAIDVPRIGRDEPVPSAGNAPADALIQQFGEYLESRRRAAGTIKQRLRHVRKFATSYPELAAVTPEQVDAWVRAQAEGKMPATVNSVIKSLRAFYRWADRFGVVRPDPTMLLDMIPNPHRMGRTVSDDELARVLPDVTAQVRAMLLLGRLAGLRLTEIASLRVDSRAGDWLTIVGKGDKQRRIFVVPELAAALDAITGDSAFFFPARPAGGVEQIGSGRWRARVRRATDETLSPGTFATREEATSWLAATAVPAHMHPHSVHKIIKRAAGINPHALRHAAGTAAYQATKDLRATQAFLGHSSPNTTAIYVHVADDALRAVTTAGALAPGQPTRAHT